MEAFNFALDLLLIGAAVWTIIVVRGSEGIVGRAFHLMMWGMILLGVAHISETITFEILKWEVDVVEFAHRLIVLGGIVFLVSGFSYIKKIQGEKIEILEQSKIELKERIRELDRTAKMLVRRDLELLQTNEAARLLDEAKAKDEALLKSIGEGMIVTDTDMKITIINKQAEAMLRWKIQDIIGKSLFNVLSVEDEEGNSLSREKRPIQQTLSTGAKATNTGLYYVRKDETRFPVAITASPVILDGKTVGTIVIFRDITKEKEIDRAKSEFVSLASHQLRTPLTAVSWYAEMLLRSDVGEVSEKQKKYLEKIYHNSQRMVELINALLNVSRIELGTLAIEPELVNLAKIADSVLDELSPLVQKKELQIKKNYDRNLPAIEADPRLMRIVFQNLLSNSVKYTPDGGTVSLTISAQDARLPDGQGPPPKDGQVASLGEKKKLNALITVSDTGYGIPESQQSKIFKKLFRADNVREKDPDGTGLGLYIVKAVVEQSGGRIWFESEENKGTTFYVTIPLRGVKKKEGTKGLV